MGCWQQSAEGTFGPKREEVTEGCTYVRKIAS